MEAVFEFIADERPTRKRLLERFTYDGERDVSAVINDLVRSGLVSTTGSGDTTVLGVTPNDVLRSFQREHDSDSFDNWIWLLVFRKEANTIAALIEATRGEKCQVEGGIERLVAHGRIKWDGDRLKGSNVVLPVGAEQGWESAVLDHFRAVAVAIAEKVRLGLEPSAQPNDEIGGSTFTFTVTPNHPYEHIVRRLLSRHRQEVQALWDSVAEYNRFTPPDVNEAQRVTYYLGQMIEAKSARESTQAVKEDE